MKIEEATIELPDIICNDEKERADVVKILHKNNYKAQFHIFDGGLCVHIAQNKGFFFSTEPTKATYPVIPASAFIKSNTP